MLEAERVALEGAQTMIRMVLQSGACADANELAEVSLGLATLNVDPSLRLSAMLDSARALFVSGNPALGLSVATQTILLATSVGDSRSEMLAATQIGVFSAETGDFPSAMAAYARALSLAHQENDVPQEIKIWTNLSAALCYSGMYREAIAAVHKGLEVASNAVEPVPNLAPLHANLANYHLNLQEPLQGIAAIRKAVDLAGTPSDAMGLHSRVLAESHFTRLLIEAEEFNDAKLHALEAKKFAGMTRSPRTEMYANAALGLAEVFCGESDQGITRLTSVLIQAQLLKLPTREVLVALVRAHEHLNNHAQALIYLKQMLETQRATQVANVLKHVERYLAQLHLQGDFAFVEDGKQVIKRLAQHAELIEGRAAKAELGLTKEQLFSVRVDLLERLAVTTELRDDSTGEHAYRVGKLAALLAKAANCPPDFVEMMDIAGRLHDIGKIGIPDGVLLKAAKFNDAERTVMEEHARIGGELLQKSQIPEIQIASDIAHYHHERWDGKGYPSKRAGEDIPLCARIAAIADVFDALSHARSYKPAWSLETTLNEIRGGRGTQFDPKLTDIFLKMMDELIAEHGTAAALDEFLGAHARTTAFYHSRHDIMENIYGARRQFPAEVKEEAGAAVVAADKKTS